MESSLSLSEPRLMGDLSGDLGDLGAERPGPSLAPSCRRGGAADPGLDPGAAGDVTVAVPASDSNVSLVYSSWVDEVTLASSLESGVL